MRINRIDSVVIVTLESLAGDFEFRFNAGTSWAALLLVSSLVETMSVRMQAVRQDAYAQGWRDAKAKRKRETLFSGRMP